MNDNLTQLIEALQIFSKYMSDDEKELPTHCEHDILYISCTTNAMTPEELTRLEELGFDWGESGRWTSYKYGSA